MPRDLEAELAGRPPVPLDEDRHGDRRRRPVRASADARVPIVREPVPGLPAVGELERLVDARDDGHDLGGRDRQLQLACREERVPEGDEAAVGVDLRHRPRGAEPEVAAHQVRRDRGARGERHRGVRRPGTGSGLNRGTEEGEVRLVHAEARERPAKGLDRRSVEARPLERQERDAARWRGRGRREALDESAAERLEPVLFRARGEAREERRPLGDRGSGDVTGSGRRPARREDRSHRLDRGHAGDRPLREAPAGSDRPGELPVQVDRAPAHAGDDARLCKVEPRKGDEDDRTGHGRVPDDTEDLDVEPLDSVTPDDGQPVTLHAGPDFLTGRIPEAPAAPLARPRARATIAA